MGASIDISLSRATDDVYECDDCGHVWKVPHDRPPSPPTQPRVKRHVIPGYRRQLAPKEFHRFWSLGGVADEIPMFSLC
jgi:hypothetical protein